jgi:1,4-dihydroxy-6-naphthoate synthase
MSPIADALRWGQAADPVGAFLAHGLAFGRVPTDGLAIEPWLAGQAELDRLAQEEAVDVALLSPAAWALLADRYVLLDCGLRMRRQGGPWIVSREPLVPQALTGKTLAVTGEHASGLIALRRCLPDAHWEFVPEGEVARRVADGEADAGVLPAEELAGPAASGLHPLLDLAGWWAEHTGGLPLPLGVLAARRALGLERLRRVARVARRSVEHSLRWRDQALAYAVQLSRPLTAEEVARLVDEEVGPWTVDAAGAGRPALEAFLQQAEAGGFIPPGVHLEFEGF